MICEYNIFVTIILIYPPLVIAVMALLQKGINLYKVEGGKEEPVWLDNYLLKAGKETVFVYEKGTIYANKGMYSQMKNLKFPKGGKNLTIQTFLGDINLKDVKSIKPLEKIV